MLAPFGTSKSVTDPTVFSLRNFVMSKLELGA